MTNAQLFLLVMAIAMLFVSSPHHDRGPKPATNSGVLAPPVYLMPFFGLRALQDEYGKFCSLSRLRAYYSGLTLILATAVFSILRLSKTLGDFLVIVALFVALGAGYYVGKAMSSRWPRQGRLH